MWYPEEEVTEKHICVHDADTPLGDRRNGCKGDSGGPMMCGCEHNVQAGITSFGDPDCSGRRPAVYTRVSEYRDWIQHYTGV